MGAYVGLHYPANYRQDRRARTMVDLSRVDICLVVRVEGPAVESKFVTFPVFKTDNGDRLVFPKLYFDDEDGRFTEYNTWAHRRRIEMALGVTEEKERLVVPVVDGQLILSHVAADALHPGFEHGGSAVWLISGPHYDKIVEEQSE
jgi:hypothetical protein